MKYLLFFLLLLITGCAGNYVSNPDGSKYLALSEKEIARLVNISRSSSKINLKKRLITNAEYSFIMNTPPGIRITYRGDRFGTAVISWQTRERILSFSYEDDLTAMVIAGCSFSTYTIPEHERGIRPAKSLPGR